MILRLIVMFWVLSAPVTNVPVEDGRLVMFWNLENFFDFTDGFGYVTPSNYQVYDNPMHQFIRLDKAEADTIKGMVYLQKIAEDFHSR